MGLRRAAQDAHLPVGDRARGLPPRPRRVRHRPAPRDRGAPRRRGPRRGTSAHAHALDGLADIVAQGKDAIAQVAAAAAAAPPPGTRTAAAANPSPAPPRGRSGTAASKRSSARSSRIRPRSPPILRTPMTSRRGG